MTKKGCFVLAGLSVLFCCWPQPVTAKTHAQAAPRLDKDLLRAVTSGANSRALRLIRRGANVNIARGADDVTPLILAARYSSVSVVDALLQRGANVNAQTNAYQSTALIFAAERGNVRIVKLLLAHGANIDHMDGDGWTALQGAQENNQHAVVQLLETRMRQRHRIPTRRRS